MSEQQNLIGNLLLYGGSVYTADHHVHDDWGVLIKGDHIQSVGPVNEILIDNESISRIDVQGGTILPGLIDAHRHIVGQNVVEVTPKRIAEAAITGVRVAKETLEDGITTVRDPGCKHGAIFVLRDMINQGVVPGPTIYAAGQNPTGHAAPQDWRNIYIEGPWSMRRAVRELIRDGADWIKIIIDGVTERSDYKSYDHFLADEEIQAAIDETHALGRRISCHVESLEQARFVVNAGMDSIEHGMHLDNPLVQRMAEKGVHYVPTLWVFRHELEMETIDSHREAAYRAVLDRHKNSFKKALDAGVNIAVGTDSVEDIPPRDCFVAELECMIESGMSHSHALKAATIGGADLLGMQGYLGRLASGYLADIIVVTGNPLNNISALKQVELVVKHGKIVISKFEI